MSDLVNGSYGGVAAKLIYGVFTTPQNSSISGSAVCAFNLQDITNNFDKGSFKHQPASNSNWLPVDNSKVPDPRPGQCISDSRNLPEVTANFINSHPLMDESVNSFFGRPLVTRSGAEYVLQQYYNYPTCYHLYF
jgi:semaphorin 6